MNGDPVVKKTEKRPPTMQDVAEMAGVSRALVSLVMRDSPKVSELRRTAVLTAAQELGYRPNAAARNLAERRSNTLGVVINDLHNMFFADVVDGIHEAAQESGYRLLLNAVWQNDADEQRVIDAFLEYRVDAVLVLGSRADSRVLQDAAKIAPVVTIGSAVPGVDVVVNDDEHGAELVVEHLVELGHTDIVHIDGGRGAGAVMRRRGFVAAMEESGLIPQVVPGDFTERSGAEAVDALLAESKHPSAIFAANDLSAIAALSRLQEAGFRVPDDISVVGYDNLSLASLHHIDLTTIDQPRVEMGRIGARRAFERIDGGRRARSIDVVAPELIDRTTTAVASGLGRR